jgi:hypothetical protein
MVFKYKTFVQKIIDRLVVAIKQQLFFEPTIQKKSIPIMVYARVTKMAVCLEN